MCSNVCVCAGEWVSLCLCMGGCVYARREAISVVPECDIKSFHRRNDFRIIPQGFPLIKLRSPRKIPTSFSNPLFFITYNEPFIHSYFLRLQTLQTLLLFSFLHEEENIPSTWPPFLSILFFQYCPTSLPAEPSTPPVCVHCNSLISSSSWYCPSIQLCLFSFTILAYRTVNWQPEGSSYSM